MTFEKTIPMPRRDILLNVFLQWNAEPWLRVRQPLFLLVRSCRSLLATVTLQSAAFFSIIKD